MGLTLTRKVGQEIDIKVDDVLIKLVLTRIKGKEVRITVDAPRDRVTIERPDSTFNKKLSERELKTSEKQIIPKPDAKKPIPVFKMTK